MRPKKKSRVVARQERRVLRKARALRAVSRRSDVIEGSV
jgi:hypothetical protein